MAENIIKVKSYEFALRIITLCEFLRENKHYEIASQLLRAGTSIGANVEEASGGQTKKDFMSRMVIASKEARETNYWLRLIRDSRMCKENKIIDLLSLSEELVKILTAIVKTGYQNSNN